MKRDWDTIREILLATEALEPSRVLHSSDYDSNRFSEVGYHVQLLEEAGLVQATIAQMVTLEQPEFAVHRLTWNGHELLDAVRNDTIWKKTKATFVDKGATMTFELVKAVAVGYAKAKLGL